MAELVKQLRLEGQNARLKARVKELEAALREIAGDCSSHCKTSCLDNWAEMENCPQYKARAALGEKKE